MFWLAMLIRLVRPIPPTPTAAMLSVSLGGVNPRPRTCRGTMAHAAPPAATLVRNVRREISFFLLMSISPGLHYRPLVESLRRQVLGDPSKQRGTGQKLRRKTRKQFVIIVVSITRRSGQGDAHVQTHLSPFLVLLALFCQSVALTLRPGAEFSSRVSGANRPHGRGASWNTHLCPGGGIRKSSATLSRWKTRRCRERI